MPGHNWGTKDLPTNPSSASALMRRVRCCYGPPPKNLRRASRVIASAEAVRPESYVSPGNPGSDEV